jgi:hypothetical protein
MKRRKPMKRFLIGAVVCLAFAASAAAQQSAANTPATKQDVEKLLQVMHMHQTMQRMAEAMSKPMHRMVHEQYLKEEKKCKFPPDFEARMNKIMDESMKQMPWDQMLQTVVPVYQKHFTEADIDALIAFYSGPTGQKFMREMPAISAETMQATMPLMLKYNKELGKRIAEEFARAKKESKEKSCPGTSAQKQ